jgi:transcriptional regulator with XRE-family HTH domain
MQHFDFAQPNNLKQLREAKGITRRTLAMACAADVSQILKYEKGERMPSYRVLRTLARFLGVSIEEIYPTVTEIDKRLDQVKEMIINISTFSANK